MPRKDNLYALPENLPVPVIWQTPLAERWFTATHGRDNQISIRLKVGMKFQVREVARPKLALSEIAIESYKLLESKCSV
jgi:hypothetical protein